MRESPHTMRAGEITMMFQVVDEDKLIEVSLSRMPATIRLDGSGWKIAEDNQRSFE